MSAYINGIGMISPQPSFGESGLSKTWQEYSTQRLACIEPDYATFIDPKQLRRMSRILKMGMASANRALQEAGLEKPEGIVTGTSYGCMEDTGIFLRKMIDNHETALNPTPFIQSTHNTIGSQIALQLQCFGYNQTYSQHAASFEHALLDALILMPEHDTVLVGGVDETTDHSFDILNRFHINKFTPVHNFDLFSSDTAGTITGEGAGYFVLSNTQQASSYAVLKNVATFHKPQSDLILQEKIKRFMQHESLRPEDIDLVITGKNGDIEHDAEYDVIQKLFRHASIGVYKHLCGEYPTATSFALWLACNILKHHQVPPIVLLHANPERDIKNILISNCDNRGHHSLILLASC